MNTPLLARDCLSLHQVRTAVAATSVDGRLYAVGGECETKFSHEGTLYLSSVEYYDPIQNSWAYVAEMKQPRSFACSGEGIFRASGPSVPSLQLSVCLSLSISC